MARTKRYTLSALDLELITDALEGFDVCWHFENEPKKIEAYDALLSRLTDALCQQLHPDEY